MIHHNKKLFKPEFVPVPFCYAVRRPGHAPDGSLVIECGTRGGSKVQALCVCVCVCVGARDCQNTMPRENASQRASECAYAKF